jgi:SagB-type dehydrogenase family enzyme
MLAQNDGTTLAELFHLNSRVWTNNEPYSNPANEAQYRDLGGESVQLPHDFAGAPLLGVIAKRRSCRKYANAAISKEAVGAILHGAYGISGVQHQNSSWATFERMVPSGGGLYPLELYASVENVEEIPDGVYHYSPLRDCVEHFPGAPSPSVMRAQLLQPGFVEGANLIVFITADFSRVLAKYGPRGYRYVLLEAGHVAQNLCLIAGEASLGSLCLGGFEDSSMNSSLGLDGKNSAVVYCVAAGCPA